jgi:hypothetical protein
MAEIDYAALAKQAASAVEGLKEPALSIAYAKILDDLIASEKAKRSAGRTPDERTMSLGAQLKPDETIVDRFLTGSFDAAQYADLLLERGELVTKCLAVLKLARDEFGVDGLTPSELAEILTKKFRASGVHRGNIARDLGKSLKLVSRVQQGARTVYMLTGQGEEALKKFIAPSNTQ